MKYKELLSVLLSKFYSFVPLCDTREAIEVYVLCSSLAHLHVQRQQSL